MTINKALHSRETGKFTTNHNSAPDRVPATTHAEEEVRLVAALAEAGGEISVDEIRAVRQAYVDEHWSEPAEWNTHPVFNTLSSRWCLSAELYAVRASGEGFTVRIGPDSGRRIQVLVTNPSGATYDDICYDVIPAGAASGLLDYKPIIDNAVAVNKRAYAGEYESIEAAFVKNIFAEMEESAAASKIGQRELYALITARHDAEGRWVPDESKANAAKLAAQAAKERLGGSKSRVEFVFLGRSTTN